MHWPGQCATSLPAPSGGPLRLGSTTLIPAALISLAALTVRVNLFSERNTSVCSSEVNFYFLAGRTSIPMLLMAPSSAQAVAAQSIKCHSQRGWGVTSHSRLKEWGGSEYAPPTDLCQQEAMTHLNPKSCLLSAPHTMDQTWQHTGHQHTGHCLGHNPAPLTGQQSSLLVGGPQ